MRYFRQICLYAIDVFATFINFYVTYMYLIFFHKFTIKLINEKYCYVPESCLSAVPKRYSAQLLPIDMEQLTRGEKKIVCKTKSQQERILYVSVRSVFTEFEQLRDYFPVSVFFCISVLSSVAFSNKIRLVIK